MLRLFSSKIFREDLSDFALPMVAFGEFDDDVKVAIGANSGTFKFCLPVSIGDFHETNVPACFSNDVEDLEYFVNRQKKLHHRKAFIISDFQVSDLDDICFSGVISTTSQKGLTDYLEKSTSICITFKNPITTYSQEGISPRDLVADVRLFYERISDPSRAFPSVIEKAENVKLEDCRDIIYQAYMASVKIHEASEMYDGDEYNTHTLFFVDSRNRVRLYEIVGEESFLGRAKRPDKMINSELDYVHLEMQNACNKVVVDRRSRYRINSGTKN